MLTLADVRCCLGRGRFIDQLFPLYRKNKVLLHLPVSPAEPVATAHSTRYSTEAWNTQIHSEATETGKNKEKYISWYENNTDWVWGSIYINCFHIHFNSKQHCPSLLPLQVARVSQAIAIWYVLIGWFKKKRRRPHWLSSNKTNQSSLSVKPSFCQTFTRCCRNHVLIRHGSICLCQPIRTRRNIHTCLYWRTAVGKAGSSHDFGLN